MTSRSIGARLRLVVVASMVAAGMALAPSVSAASPINSLTFTKICTFDHCTVTAPSGPIPTGSTLTYTGPRFDPHLSSAFVLALPSAAGTASGHCSLQWATGLGTCVIDGGTGALAGFHASLSEWVDFGDGNFESFVFHLDGTYHVDGANS